MQTITEEEPGQLVFRVRSPLQITVGGLGFFFLCWLAVHWFTRQPDQNRTIDLFVASIACLFFMLFSEKSTFVFDAGTRCLNWTRRVGFVRRRGEIPFDEIEHVVVRTALGSDADAPSQRLVLLTRNGELPLTVSCCTSNLHAAHAERLRIFLGQALVEPLSASVDALIVAGRDLDAIRELRLARGMSLTEAHAEVERIRTSHNGGS